MSDHHSFGLGDLRLQSGMTLPGAVLAYKTYGRLNADRSNLVLYPTSYGATHADTEWLIAPDKVLDPERWFVVIPNQLGNGASTSPSNAALPIARGRWPGVTHVDNVAAQHRLVTEAFGVSRIALVYGWSMGAQQALHWGALHPDMVARLAAVCGSAKTSRHNHVFLEGVKAALTGDPHWTGDHFAAHPERGLRAMGRVYAGWAMSQAFYRERLYETVLGFGSLEDYLVRSWEANYLRRDGDNLLAMLWTWQRSDISANALYGGDLDRALGAITARAYIMPGRTDLYFTPEDAEVEAARMPNAVFRPIESIWGHRAGNPSDCPADLAFLREAVRELLDTPS